MFVCRKIYANLLLLSVMLFVLAASPMSRHTVEITEEFCWQSSSAESFQWEAPGGTIVYRGSQMTAVCVGSLDYLEPESVELGACSGVTEHLLPRSEQTQENRLCCSGNPRGPPHRFFVG